MSSLCLSTVSCSNRAYTIDALRAVLPSDQVYIYSTVPLITLRVQLPRTYIQFYPTRVTSCANYCDNGITKQTTKQTNSDRP